jgi:hypothetical protein
VVDNSNEKDLNHEIKVKFDSAITLYKIVLMNASYFTIFSMLFQRVSLAQNQEIFEEQLREQVSQESKESYSKCSNFDLEAISYVVVKKEEFWSVCNLKNKRIIKIETQKDTTTYT